MSTEIIKRYYEKLNYPGTERLFKEIIKKHPSIIKEDVKIFVDDQLETQPVIKPRNKKQRWTYNSNANK